VKEKEKGKGYVMKKEIDRGRTEEKVTERCGNNLGVIIRANGTTAYLSTSKIAFHSQIHKHIIILWLFGTHKGVYSNLGG
jgi:hypothetical protein